VVKPLGIGSREWVVGPDPLHQDCSAPITWTTVNLAEAFPGVPTPLTWTVVGPVFEAMARAGWVMIGVMPRSYAAVSPNVEQRLMTIFHGRPAFSLDAWRLFGDSMPGTSAEAVETQIFGAASGGSGTGDRSTAVSSANWRRYPVVAAKMPLAARRSRRSMLQLAGTTDRWWRSAVSGGHGGSRAELLTLLHDAQQRILTVGSHHTVLSMLAFATYEQVRLLSVQAGLPGLETELLGGDGAEEARTIADLWALSRDLISRAEFLDRHGFHGRAEGELATPSWRQHDAPLRKLLATYRTLDDEASPSAGQAGRLAVRKAAEGRLLAVLGPARRAQAQLLFAMAHRYMPLRELGRCTFLKAIDVARYAALEIGTGLVREGVLAEPEDVFHLCLHELDSPPADARTVVATRRTRHAEYGALELPEVFTGSPTPTPITASDTGEGVTGLGVSSGVAQGRARVILELGEDEVEAGEILVCRTTDPGWASYFFVAGGVVIDVGGPISHGAIVARELGIPCVINTRNGTQRLRTGDLIRVDGAGGTVILLEKESAR
jgi:pyruvate,water dikinase